MIGSKLPIRIINTKTLDITLFKNTRMGKIELINQVNEKCDNIYRSYQSTGATHI